VIIRHVVAIASFVVLFASGASAQLLETQPTLLPTPGEVGVIPTPTPSAIGAPQTPAPAQPPAKTLPTPQAPTTQAPLMQTPPRKIRGRDVNVQIELTITEHQGGTPGEKRVVSMIVADAAFGRIRSTASQDVKLNIDATPTMLDNDRIALELTIEYIPVTPEGASRRPAGLLEMLTVILQNGKPLQISQAADPTIDRRITAEVRASVMK
jgi:hypothetical protein